MYLGNDFERLAADRHQELLRVADEWRRAGKSRPRPRSLAARLGDWWARRRRAAATHAATARS